MRNALDRSCREILQTEVVEKVKTHISCSINFFPEKEKVTELTAVEKQHVLYILCVCL